MFKKLLTFILAPFGPKLARLELIHLPDNGICVAKVNIDGFSSSQRHEFLASFKKMIDAQRESGKFKGKILLVPVIAHGDLDIQHLSDEQLAEIGLARIGEA